MTREFPIPAPNLLNAWLLPGVLLLIAVVAGIAQIRSEPGAGAEGLLGIAIIALGIGWSLRRRRATIEDGRLIVQAGLFSTRRPIADFDLDAARIVNLKDVPALKPGLKLFGLWLMGYAGGYFWLRDRSTAFVLLTDAARVLVLPDRKGRKVLLSVEQPQTLLDALRTVARGRGRR